VGDGASVAEHRNGLRESKEPQFTSILRQSAVRAPVKPAGRAEQNKHDNQHYTEKDFARAASHTKLPCHHPIQRVSSLANNVPLQVRLRRVSAALLALT